MSTLPSIALFLFCITFFVLPSKSESIVQLKYAREEIQRTEGHSLTLKCTVEYEKEKCEDIQVYWQLGDRKHKLINMDKYMIRINETKMTTKMGFRERHAFMSLEKLTIADTGRYQCIAECKSNSATAAGHFISVTVTGDVIKDQKTRNQSDQYSQDMFLLMFMLFLHTFMNT